MKPDFICIGAQKAGTSWLYSNLAKHPEFSLLPIKEFHYFDRERSYPSPNTLAKTSAIKRLRSRTYRKRCAMRIRNSLRSKNFKQACWWARYSLLNYSDSWYLSLFESERGITGDVTPSYSILDEKDVERMHSTIPSAKIVFLIRNPIDRAWSMFRFREQFGHELDLQDIKAFRSFIHSPQQELRSDYTRTIDLFSRHYNSGSILIGFYDAISRDPQGLLSEIVNHLGANSSADTGVLRKVFNQSKPVGIPTEFYSELKDKYRNDIRELASRYGSYATEWQQTINDEKVNQSVGSPSPSPVIIL